MESRKCKAHRSNGEPCNKWAIQGGAVCNTHGGSAPQVKMKAEERIALLVDPAINRIKDLIDNGENDSVRLSAAKDALDRAGLKPVEKRESRNITDLNLREVPDDVLKSLVEGE